MSECSAVDAIINNFFNDFLDKTVTEGRFLFFDLFLFDDILLN